MQLFKVTWLGGCFCFVVQNPMFSKGFLQTFILKFIFIG